MTLPQNDPRCLPYDACFEGVPYRLISGVPFCPDDLYAVTATGKFISWAKSKNGTYIGEYQLNRVALMPKLAGKNVKSRNHKMDELFLHFWPELAGIPWTPPPVATPPTLFDDLPPEEDAKPDLIHLINKIEEKRPTYDTTREAEFGIKHYKKHYPGRYCISTIPRAEYEAALTRPE